MRSFSAIEWTMPVNDISQDEIFKLDSTLIPPGFQGDVRSIRVMQESLTKLLDALGEQSAAAQGLNRVITTVEKLRNSPSHTLYVLKDAHAKGGRGEIIGLLKVGRKHLFLFDSADQVREVEPLCVLDFYVQGSRQRNGYGRMLFDYMLNDQECQPQELAIDGPSPKMEQFLAKNYGIEKLIRQNNNFAVTRDFFEYHDGEAASSRSGRSTPAAAAAVGRFAAPRPPSAIANVIHGGAHYYDNGDSHESPEDERDESPERWDETGDMCGEIPDCEDEEFEEPIKCTREGPPVVEGAERPNTLPVAPGIPGAGAGTGAGVGAGPGAGEAGGPGAGAPPAGLPSGGTTPAAGSLSRRDSQLTDRGFFDVKFYHNKLW